MDIMVRMRSAQHDRALARTPLESPHACRPGDSGTERTDCGRVERLRAAGDIEVRAGRNFATIPRVARGLLRRHVQMGSLTDRGDP